MSQSPTLNIDVRCQDTSPIHLLKGNEKQINYLFVK